MQATDPNVFGLKNSGVEAFLYADIGAELNGSALTILSMIARLGRDPWAEAARWAALPRAGAIESLARDIDQMPLAPSALAEARAIATRLVQLLPATTPGAQLNGLVKTEASAMPNWLPVTLLYGAVALGMAVSGVFGDQAVTSRCRCDRAPHGSVGRGHRAVGSCRTRHKGGNNVVQPTSEGNGQPVKPPLPGPSERDPTLAMSLTPRNACDP